MDHTRTLRTSTAEMSILSGHRRDDSAHQPPFIIRPAESPADLDAYHRLRRTTFVDDQRIFASTDHDDIDDDPRTIVLLAHSLDGGVLGGVRLAPHGGTDIGWWTGSRLVVDTAAHSGGIGPALVRAACAHAQARGVLRFDATVQERHRPMFTRLGWESHGSIVVGGTAHRSMRWPLHGIQEVADATKSFLAEVLDPLRAQSGGLGPDGFRGDDGVPVPGSDIVAACDAIIPSMVERDPEWAGWCSVLVNINDLSAMGAVPSGLLDAVGAPTRSLLTRVIRGIASASQAWGVPVLGGHTQIGVPASLAVTALGATRTPVRAGGASVGDAIRLTADVTGTWRPGHHGRQWDSTSTRSGPDLRTMTGLVAAMAPRAAKDVSMAGIAGTTGMMAEACGAGAELDVASIPRPAAAEMGSWLTCFPGFAMLTADASYRPNPLAGQSVPDGVVGSVCGRLTTDPGVRLRWPDGDTTVAVAAGVTGLGRA